jgi:hypothetical protein
MTVSKDRDFQAVRTLQQVADIMTRRGVRMTAQSVYSAEQRALRKLRRALAGMEK